MTAALYCRVSTDMQNEGYSIDAQKELLKTFCKLKEIDDYDYYVDGGFSGSNIKRPMLEKLISDCKSHRVNIVIVYKLDRLSRSQKDTLFLIEEIFIPNGVDFISISENFDTTSPFGKAMIGILSVFAQLERETIKERTRMGMRERLKKGYWPGGGNLPHGYDYDKTTGILVQNENAPVVKKMFELYLQGWSTEKIANYFGLKYDKIVMQILKGKINAGVIEYGGIEYPGLHQPIVSKDLFDEVNRLIDQRSKNNIRRSENLLTGLIYCGVCGAKMRYQKWGNAGHKICCYSQQSSKSYMIKDPNCNNVKHWAYEIEDAVISQLLKFSLNPNLIKKRSDDTELLKNTSLKQKINEIDKKINNLINFLADGIAVDETKTHLTKLKEEKELYIKIFSDQTAQIKKLDLFSEKITGLDKVWDQLTSLQKRGIIQSVIDKIIITVNKIDIFYTFES